MPEQPKLAGRLSHQGLSVKSAQLDEKPGQEYRHRRQVKDLRLTKAPEHRFVNTDKPYEKVTGGKDANEKEQETAFRSESLPKSPHDAENYQAPYQMINRTGVKRRPPILGRDSVAGRITHRQREGIKRTGLGIAAAVYGATNPGYGQT